MLLHSSFISQTLTILNSSNYGKVESFCITATNVRGTPSRGGAKPKYTDDASSEEELDSDEEPPPKSKKSKGKRKGRKQIHIASLVLRANVYVGLHIPWSITNVQYMQLIIDNAVIILE